MSGQNCCDEYWDLINDCVDGRLHGRGLDRVQSHLASCEACRDAAADIRFMRQSLAADETPQPAGEFWSGCFSRLESSDSGSKRSLWWSWKPAFGLAAATLVAALTLWLAPGRAPEPAPAFVPEVPVCDYVMEHAGFTAAQPLSVSSHHVLLYSRCAENRAKSGDADDGLE